MSINRPSWPHSAIDILEKLNPVLRDRLNSDQRPQGLWSIETGQLNLSRPGSLQLIWSILGGRIGRGAQYLGPDMPAGCVAVRKLRLQAECRVNRPDTVGITPDDIRQAEEVLRALIIVWNQLRPADFDDEEEQEEQWSQFSGDPGQTAIIFQYRVTPWLMVLKDPYLFKQIDAIDATSVPVVP